MSFSFNGRDYLTDDEGFLQDLNLWSLEAMHEMANIRGFALTDKHIAVIKIVRNYFLEFNTTPTIRGLITLLKKEGHEDIATSVELAKLFPDGVAKEAARYAGLKKPARCM